MLYYVKRNLGVIFMIIICFLALMSGMLVTYLIYNVTPTYNTKLNSIHYAVIILSDSNSEGKRDMIRSTWFNLVNNLYIIDHIPIYEWSLNPNDTVSRKSLVNYDWLNKHLFSNVTGIEDKWKRIENKLNGVEDMISFYFVIGIYELNTTTLSQLHYENKANKDLLLLDNVDDKYESLSAKVMQSLHWVNKNLKNVKYVVKCDDDSFVRIDLIVRDLAWYAPLMRAPVLREFITYKDNHLSYNGLYWGYFAGDAEIQSKGRWSEDNWFLCDKYLPYALGGGYVISKSVVDFIAKNADVLSKYTCEDASMGVWTAPLNIKRIHDIRFESGHMTRRCDNNVLVRHKLSQSQVREMYDLLLVSAGKTLCVEEFLGKSYLYLWGRAPSQCCNGYVW